MLGYAVQLKQLKKSLSLNVAPPTCRMIYKSSTVYHLLYYVSSLWGSKKWLYSKDMEKKGGHSW